MTTTNSTCCTNADEVVLLLKSSDRVADDICHAFDACPAWPAEPVQHVLVLKKQYDLRPEREFRCFVRGQQLMGKATCLANLLYCLPSSNESSSCILFVGHIAA